MIPIMEGEECQLWYFGGYRLNVRSRDGEVVNFGREVAARYHSSARAGARACLDETGSNILLICGTVEEITHPFSRGADVFDFKTNNWVKQPEFPPMNKAWSEFVLARVPGKGIVVAGGTNRYRFQLATYCRILQLSNEAMACL